MAGDEATLQFVFFDILFIFSIHRPTEMTVEWDSETANEEEKKNVKSLPTTFELVAKKIFNEILRKNGRRLHSSEIFSAPATLPRGTPLSTRFLVRLRAKNENSSRRPCRENVSKLKHEHPRLD